MANPITFTPVLLDQPTISSRQIINQLPVIHQTDTLQKFFDSSINHLFSPGQGKQINGYIGQQPKWYDPSQDFYLSEPTSNRAFYQLEASMVSKDANNTVTNLLFYPDIINQLRYQGAITTNHDRLFEQNYYSWCPPINLDMLMNFKQYYWIEQEDYQADYFVIERGCADGNPWSVRNYWYHRDDLTSAQRSNNTRASRPIIEFQKNLALYNYGTSRRNSVYGLIDKSDIIGLINSANNISSSILLINDTLIDIRINPVRILLTNNVDNKLNNQVYQINYDNKLSLSLETDGLNLTGLPVIGETLLIVALNKEMFFNGNDWIFSQHKGDINKSPLFNLYDVNNVALDDKLTYPVSTFTGNKLFCYQIDDTGTSTIDPVLKIPLTYDKNGQINFQNYLVTDRYSYYVNQQTINIKGFYFHKIITGSNSVYSNDWFPVHAATRQMMVDQYVCDGINQIFELSQIPDKTTDATSPNLIVYRISQSKNAVSDYSYETLIENVDYVLLNSSIILRDSNLSDVLKIMSYSATPFINPRGFYEVASNLKTNATNDQISVISSGDYNDQFSEILKNQDGFNGQTYAVNNWRNTPQDRSKGRTIIQHQSSLLNLSLTLSQNQLDFMNAARFVEGEYVRFRNKFEQSIIKTFKDRVLTVATDIKQFVTDTLTQLAKGKTQTFPFANNQVAQLDVPTFVPATPSYLGMYPIYQPGLAVDNTFTSQYNDALFSLPQIVIQNHDGSLTPTYGKYQINSDNQFTLYTVDNSGNVVTAPIGVLDLRDAAILELENRIYNSINSSIVKRERPLFDWQTHYSGYSRKVEYSYNEYLYLLQPAFDRWVNQHNLNFKANTTFDEGDPFTWNWSQTIGNDGNFLPGNWRGIILYYFDTDRPHTHPWEMLGFTIKPAYWDQKYGTSPYTSNNYDMWTDIEYGYIAAGDRAGINDAWARKDLSKYIPVDEEGNLLDPVQMGIVQDYPLLNFAKEEWKFGDCGPVESAWRRSASFSFAVTRAAYLMKPARFFGSMWDTGNYLNVANQIVDASTHSRPTPSELKVHGEQTSSGIIVKYGINQWISEYITSLNQDVTLIFGNTLRGLGVQLAYKMAGFTDVKNLYVTSDVFDRIPSEDINLQLYQSPSIREEFYSGVAISHIGSSFKIYGYDLLNPVFKVIPPNTSGPSHPVVYGSIERINIINWTPNTWYKIGISVNHTGKFYECIRSHTSSQIFENIFWKEIAAPNSQIETSVEWYSNAVNNYTSVVPYGTELSSLQEVANFLNGLERYYISRGWLFTSIINQGTDISNWYQSCYQFLAWISDNKANSNSFILLNPAFKEVVFETKQGEPQSVEQFINGTYGLLDRASQPIKSNTVDISRSKGKMIITPVNPVDGAIYGCRLYVSEIEHVILFNNKTIFSDTIYDPLLNIRQPRLRMQGFKTTNWQGRIDAPGFIITGKALVPNFEKSVDDFRHFFDVETVDDPTLQERARNNIGYFQRDYLSNLLLTPTNQFEFYQGMIQHKGTPSVLNRLLRSNFIRNNKDIKFLEEWAFRVGDYGSVQVNSSFDVQLKQSEISTDPQLIRFTTLPSVANVPYANNVIDIVDIQGVSSARDPRWIWRDTSQHVEWKTTQFKQKIPGFLPNTGYVDVEDVSWTALSFNDLTDLYHNELVKHPSELIEASYTFSYDGISANPQNLTLAIIPNKISGYLRINKIEFNIVQSFVPNSMTATVGRRYSPMEFARISADSLNLGSDVIFRPSTLINLNGIEDNTVYLNFEYGHVSALGANVGIVTVTVTAEHFIHSVLPNHRVLVYNDKLNDWKTYKLHDTNGVIRNSFMPSFSGQGTPIILESAVDHLVSDSLILLDGLENHSSIDQDIGFNSTYHPVFSNICRVVIDSKNITGNQIDSNGYSVIPLMQMLSSAGMTIDNITVNVVDPFKGSTTTPHLKVGTESINNLYVKSYTPLNEFVANAPVAVNQPSFAINLPVIIDIFDTSISVSENLITVPVQIVRSGNIFRNLAAIAVTNSGQNYTSTPEVVVSGPEGVKAIAVMAGSVKQILLISGGAGYTTTPVITLTGANGNGATATAAVSNGQVVSITVITPGSNYTSEPIVIVSGGGGAGAQAYTTLNMGVSNVIVTSTGGCLYDGVINPTVSFIGGAGTGAAATAQLTPALAPMTLNWRYYRNTPDPTGWTEGGGVIFTAVEDPSNTGDRANAYWLQTVHMPVQTPEIDTSIYQIEIYDPLINDAAYSVGQDISTVTVVKTQLGNNSVNLTIFGSTVITGGDCQSDEHLNAYVALDGNNGIAIINIAYHYQLGFEVFNLDKTAKVIADVTVGGRLLAWIPTRYPNIAALNSSIVPNNWAVNDIVEIDYNPNVLTTGGWMTYQYSDNHIWSELRRETLKVDSSQFVNAIIYRNDTDEVLQRLQLFDPYQGYIIGTADRELTYKISSDPAIYNRSSTLIISVNNDCCWGPAQLHQLWWDLSTVRYIDYNIGSSAYKWKNWGRLAPGVSIDVYQWIRSPVHPTEWHNYLLLKTLYAGFLTTPKSGIVTNPANTGWVELLEWIPALNRDAIAYYFWVEQIAELPTAADRKLSAVQVASIIENPSSQDIPWFAAIESNQLIVGGIKQYLNDTSTTLKVNWKIDKNEGNHHKQWKIIREDDEVSPVDLSLWNKMRDSLIGWDNSQTKSTVTTTLAATFNSFDTIMILTDASQLNSVGEVFLNHAYVTYSYKHDNTLFGIHNSANTSGSVGASVSQAYIKDTPLIVPDPKLTNTEACGSLIRPRQSWFLSDANKHARKIFIESFNTLMQERPFLDEWFQWQLVFDRIDPVPSSSEYNIFAPSMSYRSQLALNNSINIGQVVYVPSVLENNNFWTLWIYSPQSLDADVYGYVLQRAQKWRFKQDEMWNTVDWYATNWSATDFPQIHYADRAAFLAAPLPVNNILLKGTLAAIDSQNSTDPRWSWEVYFEGKWTQVAKQNATVSLPSVYYDNNKILYGFQTYDINSIPIRDGSWELRYLIDQIPVTLFTKTQMSSLFFAMVRCALSVNNNLDWVIKTSFMSIGGYTEPLKQTPLAYSDQINSILSYVEEVKPYHVKIRNYVLQYTVGPDPLNVHVTDFDQITAEYSPSINVATLQASLQSAAQQLAQTTALLANHSAVPINVTPFLKVTDSNSVNWNGLRHSKIKILFDRVACMGINGWDTKPWDYDTIAYGSNGEVGTLLAPDYLDTLHNVHYNANVASIVYSQWDVETNLDCANRINLYYQPTIDMKPINSAGLISGCGIAAIVVDPTVTIFGFWDQFSWDFQGGWDNESMYYGGDSKFTVKPLSGVNYSVIDGGAFLYGMWDNFSWDFAGGWGNESAYYDGSIDPFSTEDTLISSQPVGETSPTTEDYELGDLNLEGNNIISSVVEIDGGTFNQVELQDSHPEELVVLNIPYHLLIKELSTNIILLDTGEFSIY